MSHLVTMPARTESTEELTIRMPQKVAEAFRAYAADSGEPVERWLNEALFDYAEAIISARMGETILPLECEDTDA